MQAAIEKSDRDFIIHAIALKSGIPDDVVNDAIDGANPRTVTALSWKAGFSMRTAMQLQLRVARVRPKSVLNARDGIDYPLSEAELEQQLKRLQP